MKRLDISEATPISMPIKNMIGIVSACLVGAYFAFSTILQDESVTKTL